MNYNFPVPGQTTIKPITTVAVVNLGCAKNQVDSEVMLGLLKQAGYVICGEPEQAELIIVNTCGFIESAVVENIDCILELAEYKNSGPLKWLVVTGCLVQRYGAELAESLPEVDLFLSCADIGKIDQMISCSKKSPFEFTVIEPFLYDHTTPRLLADNRGSAYVKIAEGCNRCCSFCIIPALRGPYRSRDLASVVAEVQLLQASGIKEINLIAQDTTAFGSDRADCDLADLLVAIDQSGFDGWVRVLYGYPLGISDKLLKTMIELPTVCDYLDLPLQHVSKRILETMSRPLGKFASRVLVERIRKQAPSIQLRTTFIVGFPGETENELRELEEFVAQGHFASVGIFPYSAEEGSTAFSLKDQLSQEEKAARVERIMLAQQRVNSERLAKLLGTTVTVLLEGLHPESDHLWQGRTAFQAPEVDGVVIINQFEQERETPRTAHFYSVKINDTSGYDLIGCLDNRPTN